MSRSRLVAVVLLLFAALVPLSTPVGAQEEVVAVDPCADAMAWWAGTVSRWTRAEEIVANVGAALEAGEATPGTFRAAAGRLADLVAQQQASAPPEAAEDVHAALVELFSVYELSAEAGMTALFPAEAPAVVQAGQAQLAILSDRLVGLGARANGFAAGFVEACGLGPPAADPAAPPAA